jgi:serine/threonine protein kinase
MTGRLGHYEIRELLATTGMSEVYRAHDTRLDRDVALKVLPPELAQSAEFIHRFECEARAVATLNHPNIVTIHSIEEVEGVHFYTMELIAGARLDALLPERGFPLERLLELARR